MQTPVCGHRNPTTEERRTCGVACSVEAARRHKKPAKAPGAATPRHEASRTDRASHREGSPRPLEGMRTGPLTEASLLGGDGVRMFCNERGSHLTTPDVLNTTESFP